MSDWCDLIQWQCQREGSDCNGCPAFDYAEKPNRGEYLDLDQMIIHEAEERNRRMSADELLANFV